MKTVMIGAGNVATHLGEALTAAGHEVLQVMSRTQTSAERLAGRVGAEPLTDAAQLRRDADVCICAVSDDALTALVPQLCQGREDMVFLHTAGSVPMSVFEGHAHRYGVLYPMQTFSKQRAVDMSEVPCFIEANDEATLRVVEQLARSVSRRVSVLSSAERRYLHLSAVFANNFVNHCYTMAAELLERHGLPFDTLLPLIDETARKVHTLSPREAQTGPAVRGDRRVVEAQRCLLADTPELQQVYDVMARSIMSLKEYD